MRWTMAFLALILLGCARQQDQTNLQASADCTDLAEHSPGVSLKTACGPGEHQISQFKIMGGEHEGVIAKINTPQGLVCCDKDKTAGEKKSPPYTVFLDCENIFGATCRDRCEDDEIQVPAFRVPEDVKSIAAQVAGASCRAITYNEFELLSSKGITLQKDGMTLAFRDPALETERVCCLKREATK